MRYHQVNNEGQIITGICKSIPEVFENGNEKGLSNYIGI
jgi:hypothetical protein